MPVLLACDLVATDFTAWNGGDLLPQRDVHCWKLTQTLEMPHGVSILHHTGVDFLKELYAILSLWDFALLCSEPGTFRCLLRVLLSDSLFTGEPGLLVIWLFSLPPAMIPSFENTRYNSNNLSFHKMPGGCSINVWKVGWEVAKIKECECSVSVCCE